MYNLKSLIVALFLLISHVLAARVSYLAWDKTGGIKREGKYEQVNGGTIPDDRVHDLIHNIGHWSHHRFRASQDRRTGIIKVVAVEQAENKNEATRLNEEARTIVLHHIPRRTEPHNGGHEGHGGHGGHHGGHGAHGHEAEQPAETEAQA